MSTLFFGNYLGIIVNKGDPEDRDRLQIFIPHISTTLFEDWNKSATDQDLSLENIRKRLTPGDPIGQRLKELLPWAECAKPLFGVGGTTYVDRDGRVQAGTNSRETTTRQIHASNLTGAPTSGASAAANAATAAANSGCNFPSYSSYQDMVNDPSGNGQRFINFASRLASAESLGMRGLNSFTDGAYYDKTVRYPTLLTQDAARVQAQKEAYTASQGGFKTMFTRNATNGNGNTFVAAPGVDATKINKVNFGTFQMSLEDFGWNKQNLSGVPFSQWPSVKNSGGRFTAQDLSNLIYSEPTPENTQNQIVSLYNYIKEGKNTAPIATRNYCKALAIITDPSANLDNSNTLADLKNSFGGNAPLWASIPKLNSKDFTQTANNIQSNWLTQTSGTLTPSTLRAADGTLLSGGVVSTVGASQKSLAGVAGVGDSSHAGPKPDVRNAQGMHSVPEPGNCVWVFFLAGDPQKPVYFAGVTEPNNGARNDYGNSTAGGAPGVVNTTSTAASGSYNDKINEGAKKLIGRSTKDAPPATQGGLFGCAYAVSLMFKEATGQDILPGRSIVLGTADLYYGMQKDPRWVPVDEKDALPGDVIVATASTNGHTAIISDNGKLIQNGSVDKTINGDGDLSKWGGTIGARPGAKTQIFRFKG